VAVVYQTTWHHIPEDANVNRNIRENVVTFAYVSRRNHTKGGPQLILSHFIANRLFLTSHHNISQQAISKQGYRKLRISEVLTALSSNIIVFSSVMPRNFVGIHYHFGRTCCVHLHERLV
jgi:hypothetical protein